jgi:hypothetical protein
VSRVAVARRAVRFRVMKIKEKIAANALLRRGGGII